ncbi:MAG: methyltransferase domain-containing protein [Tepidisphaeraceae bacterium]
MNVLFALYQNFACNSANHVDGIARELTALGCSCIVAVPSNPTQAELLGSVPYGIATFDQVLAGEIGFDNGRGIDVAHFWTPREVNRRFCERLQGAVDAKPSARRFATIIHMEDNEDLIARSQLRDSLDEYASGQKIAGFPAHLSHPLHWKKFLESADGLTVIIDALRDVIPRDKPVELTWPSTDERNFHPRPVDLALRKELGIKPDHTVLAYHGNVHQANFREVRSLYLAVALLNREGWPTTLLRMGRDHIEVDPLFRRWAAEHTRTVGFVPNRARLAELLSLADVFVQPGLCDVFNQYRFPSKVPDFFALARPVILPRTNIGLVTRHGQDAYVLDEANGPAIADAVKAIAQDEDLRRTLSSGARLFFEANLSWSATAAKILALYRRVLKGRSPVDLAEPTNGDTLNPLQRYSQTKFPPLSYATVRDYCDSADHLNFLCTMNDLKDVQRPWSAKALIGQLKPGGTILEIGAGEPRVAALLQSLGWNAIVCDPYDGSGHGPTDYMRYVKAYPNVRIIRSVFDPSIADVEGFASTPMRGRLDAVYSISVLEHVQAADLEKAFAGIEAALKPGGLSLHCADAVVQGGGAEFHVEQMARILQFQNRLAGDDADWDRSLRSIHELFAAAMQDLDTFFLGPQGHNQWRGSQPFEQFPFRKCISVQFIARKKKDSHAAAGPIDRSSQ